jgi:diguanylate cyclase (GGDEF)-like protein/PAS domain S-box-containing protein
MPDRTISFDLIPDAIVTADLNGVIRQVNTQFTTMFGYQESELIGQPIEVLLPERIRERHVRHRAVLHNRPMIRPMGGGLELHGLRKDGSEFPLDIMLSSLDDGRFLAVVRDTTLAKNMRSRLTQLAYFDSLTGLPNRAALYRALDEFFRDDGDDPTSPMSIALFDLDGFKEVNDTMGHSSGDALLKEVADRWAAVIGSGPRIFRLGGDEFILLAAGCGDPGRIAGIVDTLLQQLEAPFDIAGTTAFVSASAGIAIAPADGADTEELMANVDMALYKAKAVGRGRYAFFLNALRADAQARRDLDTKLRQAHLHGEFELYFQPQVRLTDGRIVGAEALLRWNQGRSLIAPGAFIEMLAASPISASVGNWILRTACEAAASWRRPDQPPIRVAVNLFPAQYYDPSLVAEIEGILAETGLAADLLELEITENIALSENTAAIEPLRRLRDLGVRAALDDFGTGYASLSFLTRMPLTDIKIDQTFVRGLPDDPKMVSIVRSLIAMAHHLGLNVIAEGVEATRRCSSCWRRTATRHKASCSRSRFPPQLSPRSWRLRQARARRQPPPDGRLATATDSRHDAAALDSSARSSPNRSNEVASSLREGWRNAVNGSGRITSMAARPSRAVRRPLSTPSPSRAESFAASPCPITC